MRVVLLGHLDLGEQTPVEFEGGCQMVKCLLEVPVLQVRIPELRIGGNKQKQVLFVDINQQFAKCQLLHPDSDQTFDVLRQCVLVQGLVSLKQFAAYLEINDVEVLIVGLPLVLLFLFIFAI